MTTAPLVFDDMIFSEEPATVGSPMDSSAVLLGLMTLSQQADSLNQNLSAGDSLDGVISKAVLRNLLSTLQWRDAGTVQHSRRVAMVAVGMAQFLGWEGRHLKVLEISSLLHDIGKIGVPDNILQKPASLSPDESELTSLHYNIGIDVLQACRVDAEVLEIVGQAQTDYSRVAESYRNTGRDIHQGARILAVADAYDSLRTNQVYRRGKSHEEVMTILQESSGTQFDGNVVAALSRWIERHGCPYAGQQSASTGAEKSPASGSPQENTVRNSLCQIFSYLYLLESLYDGFYLVDSDLRFVVWNQGVERMLGHQSAQMLNQVWTSRIIAYSNPQGRPLSDGECAMKQVIASGQSTTSTVRVQHAEGRWVDIELQSVPLLNQQGELQGVAEIFRDLSRSSRRPQEYQELKRAASRDPLTSVANRGELESQLTMMIDDYSQRASSDPFSVIFLDIDFFKSINDSFGHQAGDQVLIEITRLLQQETYSGELVGRYGGEEFVMLCPGTELERAVTRAERLREAISHGRITGIGDFQVTASFGVAQAEPGDSVESILNRSDRALYMAKESGRNRTCSLTTAEMNATNTPEPATEDVPNDPFVYQGSFSACIAADLVAYKLGGFVNDQNAKLLEVTSTHAQVRIGNRGLLPFWGGKDSARPVEVQITFGENLANNSRGNRATSRQVPVGVEIRPIGRIRDSEIFQARAKRVMKTLRSYFAGE